MNQSVLELEGSHPMYPGKSQMGGSWESPLDHSDPPLAAGWTASSSVRSQSKLGCTPAFTSLAHTERFTRLIP